MGVELPFISTPAGNSDAGTPSSAVAGGYFIYIRLPANISADRLTQRAQEDENLIVASESMCRVPPKAGEYDASIDRFVRLCFAWEDEDVLLEGVARVGRVLRAMLDEGDVEGNVTASSVGGRMDKFS